MLADTEPPWQRSFTVSQPIYVLFLFQFFVLYIYFYHSFLSDSLFLCTFLLLLGCKFPRCATHKGNLILNLNLKRGLYSVGRPFIFDGCHLGSDVPPLVDCG